MSRERDEVLTRYSTDEPSKHTEWRSESQNRILPDSTDTKCLEEASPWKLARGCQGWGRGAQRGDSEGVQAFFAGDENILEYSRL